jgi:gamma-glutamyltranspeptidase/glutathione hydrolase
MSERLVRVLVLAIIFTLLTGQGVAAQPIDLSPYSWPAGDLEHYTELQNNNLRPHPPASGKKGLVVGTTGALAVRSGIEALRQGGTAADAALTTSLAQITLMAGATVSFAGVFAMVYYDAATGEIHYLNASWEVPRGQTSGADIPPCGVPSGRQVLVPGFMAGLEAAHARFGALPFKSLFGPALYFARDGFEVFPMLGSWIEFREPVITRLAGGRQIFLKPDGSIYRTGDWFRQPKLAKTLKRVARTGARYMYRGAWSRKLVRLVRAQEGRMAQADLRAYEPTWLAPLSFEFGGYRIHGPNFPSLGGEMLKAAMTGLSAGALRSAGHYSASAEALAMMLEAVERRHGRSQATGGHSDGVVAIDADGNVAAVLHTINTVVWGETGIFVDGVSIADTGCYAPGWVSLVGPGGRMPGTMNPTIVTRRGKPVAATSAVGSGLFEATFFSLVNVLAYRRNPQQTVDTPTFHWSTVDAQGRVVHRAVQGDFPPDLLEAVRNRGFTIEELTLGQIRQGWWIGATIHPKTGRRKGATASAWNGLAAAQ